MSATGYHQPVALCDPLSSVVSWLAREAGQAWVTGGVARDLVRFGEIRRGHKAEILVPAIDCSWSLGLQSVARGVSVANGRDALRVEAYCPQGRRIDLHIRPLRRPQAEAAEGDGEPMRGILGDLATREITIHGFAIGADGDIVDPFGGVDDLADERIRPIASPRKIFREQPSSLLRVARYLAYYGYEVDHETRRFATRDAANILSVPRDVWLREINRVLLSRHTDTALQWLFDTRILCYLLPEVASLVGFHETCEVHHKDCWDHTLQVTQKAHRDLCTRWAALCHDIGKIWTRSVDRRGSVHFYRHEEFGAILFEGVAARFQMPQDLAERISAVINLHGRVNLYDSEWTDSAVRRLMRDTAPHLEDLLRFSRADFTSKRPHRVAEIKRQLDELEARIERLRNEEQRPMPLPKGLGNALMRDLPMEPGPALGRVRRGLESLCAAGEIESDREAAYYVEQVRTRGVDAVIAGAR